MIQEGNVPRGSVLCNRFPVSGLVAFGEDPVQAVGHDDQEEDRDEYGSKHTPILLSAAVVRRKQIR